MSRFQKRLTVRKLCEEFITWNTNHDLNSDLRFGQYITIEYLTREYKDEPASDPDIFYEEDANVAFGMIAQDIIEQPISTDDSIPVWLRRQAN